MYAEMNVIYGSILIVNNSKCSGGWFNTQASFSPLSEESNFFSRNEWIISDLQSVFL